MLRMRILRLFTTTISVKARFKSFTNWSCRYKFKSFLFNESSYRMFWLDLMLLGHRRVYALQPPTRSLASRSASFFFKSRRWQSSFTLSSHLFFCLPTPNRSSPQDPSIQDDVWDAWRMHVSDMSEVWVSWQLHDSPHPCSHPLPTWCLCSYTGLCDCEWHPLYSAEWTSQTRVISGSILLSSSMSLRCTTGPRVPVYCRALSLWRIQY